MIDTQSGAQERYGKLLYETFITELQALCFYTLTEQEEEQERWENQLDERKEAWCRAASALIAELTRNAPITQRESGKGSTDEQESKLVLALHLATMHPLERTIYIRRLGVRLQQWQRGDIELTREEHDLLLESIGQVLLYDVNVGEIATEPL